MNIQQPPFHTQLCQFLIQSSRVGCTLFNTFLVSTFFSITPAMMIHGQFCRLTTHYHITNKNWDESVLWSFDWAQRWLLFTNKNGNHTDRTLKHRQQWIELKILLCIEVLGWPLNKIREMPKIFKAFNDASRRDASYTQRLPNLDRKAPSWGWRLRVPAYGWHLWVNGELL